METHSAIKRTNYCYMLQHWKHYNLASQNVVHKPTVSASLGRLLKIQDPRSYWIRICILTYSLVEANAHWDLRSTILLIDR